MAKRFLPKCGALYALIQVYSPPKKVRLIHWEEQRPIEFSCTKTTNEALNQKNDTNKAVGVCNPDLSGLSPGVLQEATAEKHRDNANTTANACNNLESMDQEVERESTAPDRKRQKLEEKRLIKRRWVGTVMETLSDVFTAVWSNYVEPTSEFRTAAQLRPGDTKPGTDAKLVSNAFSSEKLMEMSQSFRIHFSLMQAFSSELFLADWENNAAVNAYVKFLRTDVMIRDCCMGIFARLGSEGFENVDQFVSVLRQAWFQPVPNMDKPRCGYHHVCIGEFSKAKALTGMHNWFKFLLEEEKHRTRILNWWSYQKDLHLVSMKFNMRHPLNNVWYTKPRSSFLVGVPTDFELLLFTVTTMVNPNQDTTVRIRDFEPLVVVPRSLKKSGTVVTAFFRESPKAMSD